jgi:hypothetical protein
VIRLTVEKAHSYLLRVRADLRLSRAESTDEQDRAELAEILTLTNIINDRLQALVDRLEKK